MPVHGQPSRNGRIGPREAWYRDENGKWRRAIDVKAQGGYFVAPGSRHKTGRIYKMAGSITDIPRIQGSVEEHMRAEPEPDVVQTGSEVDFSSPVSRSTRATSHNGYSHHRADPTSPEWAWAIAELDRLSPGDRVQVNCRIHAHATPAKEATVWVAADGSQGVTCHGHQEAWHLGGDPAHEPAVQILTDAATASREVCPLANPEGWETTLALIQAGIAFNGLMQPPEQAVELDDELMDILGLEEEDLRHAAQERYDELADSRAFCARPLHNIMYDASQGTLERRAAHCWAWRCPVCGERKVAATRAALVTLVDRWALPGKVARVDGITPAQRMRLTRWAKAGEDRSYMLLRVLPGVEYAIAIGEAAPLETAELALGDLVARVDEVAAEIAPETWAEHGGVARVLGGQRAVTKEITTLRDRVLGRIKDEEPAEQDGDGESEANQPQCESRELVVLQSQQTLPQIAELLSEHLDRKVRFVRNGEKRTDPYFLQGGATPEEVREALLELRRFGIVHDSRDTRAARAHLASIADDVEELGFD